jgi:NAD(P)H dehydrogenase (quinone)
MNILWIFAHPEPRSLNGALRDHGLRTLRRLGHATRQSDLYAMGWDPVVRAADYGHDPRHRLNVGRASEHAHATGRLAPDIQAEQDKLAWADALVVQFPLWWFGMPAILKGWFDRVFVQGFAFGITDAAGRTLRYGDGGLTGKRALTIVTAGARPSGLTGRGVHGPTEELLFPLLHGTFWYTGISPLRPLMIPGADRMTPQGLARHTTRLQERLRTLPAEEPLPYRREHGGDYDADLLLRPELAPGRTGLAVALDGESGTYPATAAPADPGTAARGGELTTLDR